MTKLMLTISAAALLGLAGCKASQTQPIKVDHTTIEATVYPSIKTALDCLPEEGALMAAHRGISYNWDIAENSLTGLKKLIEIDYKIAEIDVASTKDGVLFTYHDGVWDEKSTGKGPVAAATSADLEAILLKTQGGELTSDRPPLFADMLSTAKNNIYLEVDFKSSAKYEDVIKAIREAGMADQVVLIAYNPEQAAKLRQLAPEMMRSNPTEATEKGHAVWLGYNVANDDTAATFKSQGQYIIGRIGDPKRQPAISALRQASDILVTDEAEKHNGIAGLNKSAMAAYKTCLTK